MYADGEYDLAGFSVGIVEKSKIIDGSKVKVGNKLIGIASSGVHSNGYSLIRKVIETKNISLDETLNGKSLGDILLEPTRIYVKPLLTLLKSVDIHALAHITGGGITENLPRVLADNLDANVRLSSWHQPDVFAWLQTQGNISRADMLTTFNCGLGMIVCVAAEDEQETLEILQQQGETVFSVGEIVEGKGSAKVNYF
jgi:phosphoribosylformylglycinamidine cyclo-ligase